MEKLTKNNFNKMIFDLQRFVIAIRTNAITNKYGVTIPDETTDSDTGEEYDGVKLNGGIDGGKVEINNEIKDGSSLYVSEIKNGGELTADLSSWSSATSIESGAISGKSTVNVNTGSGNDTLKFGAVSSSTVLTDAGDGADIIYFGNISENSNINVNANSGADTVTVETVTNSSVQISTGDGEDSVVIKGVTDGKVTVDGGNSASTITANDINGGSIFLYQIGESSKIELKAISGLNTISVGDESGIVNVNVNIVGGTNKDIITLGGFSSGNLTISGGKGDDSILIGGDSNGGNILISGGDGTDTILIGSFGGTNLTVDGGANENLITLGAVGEESKVSIVGGDSEDTIKINGNSGNLTINSDAGNDLVSLGGDSEYSGNILISGGDGTDTILIGSFGGTNLTVDGGANENLITLGAVSNGNVSIVGGGSEDTIKINGNSGNLTIDGGGIISLGGDSNGGNISIKGGDSGNQIKIANFSNGILTINSGRDADLISLGGEVSGDISINSGAGSDKISVGAIGSGNVTINGGNDQVKDEISILSIDEDSAFVTIVAGAGDSISIGSGIADFVGLLTNKAVTINGVEFISEDTASSASLSFNDGNITFLNGWSGTVKALDDGVTLHGFVGDEEGPDFWASSKNETYHVIGGTFLKNAWAIVNDKGMTEGNVAKGDSASTNNITVKAFTDKNYTVQGGNEKDTVYIEGVNGGSISISGLDGDDEIIFNSIESGSVTIDGGVGNDTVYIGGLNESSEPLIKGGSVLVNGGVGEDLISLGGAIGNANISINADDDKNTVKIESFVGKNKYLTITSGNDNDSIYIGGDAEGGIGNGNVSINTGEGVDTIFVSSIGGGLVTINAGADNDNVTVNAITGGNVSLLGDTGNDEFYIGNISTDNDSLATNVSINGGAGADKFTIAGMSSGNLTIDGGSGDDIVSLVGSGIIGNILVRGGDSVKSVSGGDSVESVSGGNDTFYIDGLNEGKLTVESGDGNDIVSLGSNMTGGEVLINAGDGSDTIRVNSFSLLTINGGAGANDISIGAVTDGTLHANGGNADDTISLYSMSDGLVTLNGGKGNNEIKIGVGSEDDNVIVGGTLKVYGDDGNDLISFNHAIGGGEILVSAGNGANTIDVENISDGNVTINGGSEKDTISIGHISGNLTVDGGAGDDDISFGTIEGGAISINGNGGDDTISFGYVNFIEGNYLTVDGGAGADDISFGTITGGAISISGNGDNDTISVDTISGGNVTINSGDGENKISISNISGSDSTYLTILGGASKDTISIETVSGNVTIDSGEENDSISLGIITSGAISINGNGGADTINIDSIGSSEYEVANVSIVAGAGDSINIGAGMADFTGFSKGAAVTINGVEFKASLENSASLSFADNEITFLDDKWSGTIKAAESVTVKGLDYTLGSWAYSKDSGEENTYIIKNGKLYENAWAIVNGRARYTNQTLASDKTDSSNKIEVVSVTSGSYNVKGGADVDKISVATVTGGSVTINALEGNDIISFGRLVYHTETESEESLGGISGGSVLVNGGANDDLISLNGAEGNAITGGNVSLLGDTGEDKIYIGNIGNNDGNNIEVYVNGGANSDEVTINAITGDNTNISLFGGDDVDNISISAISNGNISIDGGAGTDFVSIGNIENGNITIGGGNDNEKDVILIDNIQDGNTSIVAGAGDSISIGSGSVNFFNFTESAVTINGVKFEAVDNLQSAAITFDESGIHFQDSLWSGTITASESVTFYGYHEEDSPTTLSGGDTYYVQKGTFRANAWAILNGKYLRLGTVAAGLSNEVNAISLMSVNYGEERSVQGGSKNDSIEVESIAGGSVTINALGGNDTINIHGITALETIDTESKTQILKGGNIFVDGGTNDDKITLGDITSSTVLIAAGEGKNTVSVADEYGPPKNITGSDFTIQSGESDDIISLGNISSSTVLVDVSNGVNTVSFVDDVAVIGSDMTIKGGTGVDNITLRDISSSNVLVDADAGKNSVSFYGTEGIKESTLTVNFGVDDDSLYAYRISSGEVSINGGAGVDTIFVENFIGGNLTIDAGASNDIVTLSAITGGNISVLGNGGNDKILLGNISTVDSGPETNITINGGADNNLVKLGGIESGNVSVFGGGGNDTISVDNISGGNVTINGGAGADFITVGAAGENVSIVAGAGDNISVGSGSVNFINFSEVTINGVEFKSAENSSASISFDDGINFLDENWTGTITASENIVVKGLDESFGSWTYTKGRKDNSYKVVKGQLYNDVWAKVNTKGIRNGEVAQSADESLNIEVINESLTITGNYSILGSASADTITGTDGNGISISGGGISVNADAGNDEITFGDITNGNVSVIGGAGLDTINVGNLSGGNVTLNGGADNDLISIDTITDGKVSVIGGAGLDTINVVNLSGGNVTLNGGADNDSISIGNITAGNLSISGGEGDDTISIDTITDGANVSVVAGEVLNITGGSLTAAIPTSSTINGVTFKSDSAQNETVSVEDSIIHLTGYTGTLSAAEGITIADKNGATVSGSNSYVMTNGTFATWATITNDTATLYAIQGDPITGTTNADTIQIADNVSSVSIDGFGGKDTILAQTLTDATINTNTEGDFISVTGGNIYVDITSSPSTINGAQFSGIDGANINIGNGIITVDNYNGTIVAGDNLKVSDKKGVTVTGGKNYIMTEGAFSTWATVSNGSNDTYVFNGETVVTGTTGNDTITILDAASVSVDGNGGADTITAHSLSGATINTDGNDIISVEKGDIYAVIGGTSTINGALFGTNGEAEITIGDDIITVNGYSGNITANGTKVSDNRGATVTGGNRAYTMTGGVFETWATISNNSNDSYAFAGDTVANGTDGDDQIVIETMQSVLIDGKGGKDDIRADSLHGATINAATDDISITAGDFLANITSSSTINGAAFGTSGAASVTIDSDGVINVNGYSGSVTAAGSSIVKDNRGATVNGDTTYTMTSGVFETWATINGNDYAFVGETFAEGTGNADKISIASAADVSINGKAGVDTITADSLTGATIISEDSDYISVKGGNIFAQITSTATINGALFSGDNLSDAEITIGTGALTVDGYNGSIVAGNNLTVSDKNGSTVTGTNSYLMTDGTFQSWATINGNSYALVGDTVANGTDNADRIQIADGVASVLADGKGGNDTITVENIGDNLTIDGGADADLITIGTITDGAISVAGNAGKDTINLDNVKGGNVTVDGGADADLITVDLTGAESFLALGDAGNDTIFVDNIGNGNVTIDGGAGADVITVNSAGENVSIVAGAGDNISVGSGSANFINFAAGEAVTINGVEFKSAENSSASISFDNGINFLDENWTGTITASDDMTFTGYNESESWTYNKGSNDKSYKVVKGQLYNDVWAKVNTKGIRTGEIAQSADDSLKVEVINKSLTTTGNYSILGSASADTITGTDGNGIIVSGGNVSVSAGAGNDEITFGDISGGNVTIDAGDGIDTVSIGTITDGKVTVVSGEKVNVTAGNLYASITTSSTINGAQFSGTSDADITLSNDGINVDTYTGSITAGDNITVADKNGATVTGSTAYAMTSGAFATWATIGNANETLYAVAGDTVANGTDNADTIRVADVADVLIDGKLGEDTVIAQSLAGATITSDGDYISVAGGNIYTEINGNSTINGATFTATSNAEITIGSGALTVHGYTGDIMPNSLTITDNRGATVSGSKVFTMTDGAFSTWATVSNGTNDTYYFNGETVLTGTSSPDTITISDASDVSIDGLAGVDTINANSLINATLNTDGDIISITSGNIYASLTAASTINGALFGTAGTANVTIGDGIITVDGYTGSITAGTGLTVTDKRGAKVTGNRAYEISGGEFVTWATISNDSTTSYAFAGDTVANGTSGDDTITITDADKVLIDGKGGVDTITAATLTGATINAATDLISVTAGDIYASIATNSTINGALFTGTSNAEINIGDAIITVDGYSGSITAGTGLTVTDKRGAKVTGNRAYAISGGEFVTWATVNNESYSFAGDTVANGTSGDDTISITDADKVLVDGKGGVDTITADSLTGATINAATDNISVTAGDIYASITTSSTINGAQFSGTADANITISGSSINVDGYSGSITAGTLTVTDKRGAKVTGNRAYEISGGEFVTWATVNNESYSFAGDTLATGTDSADTINIASADKVLVDGKGGVDTITADSLTGATINAATDLISVTAGDIYASITTSSTINGAQFSGTSNTNINIGNGIITVDSYNGNVIAGDVTIRDKNGATVKGHRTYEMTNGAFQSWATINGNTYVIDPEAYGTDNADTIQVSHAQDVLIDGKGGVDTITADSLTGATINASTDNISVTAGDIYASLTAASTINGALFGTAGTANVTIGDGIITVDGYTGSITAGTATVADNRGATVSGTRAYEISGGEFVTWATVNNESYSFAGDTVVTGTDSADTINIASADKVSINGLGGVDTITAATLTGATINAATDLINVTTGDLYASIATDSTINGALFSGTADAKVTISAGSINVDTYTGSITAGTGLTVTDKRGAKVTGNRAYEISSGEFVTWATVNNESYSFAGDTVVTGTTGNDTINIASADKVLVDGKGGVDTITANSLTGATINAATDLINVTTGDIYASIATDSTINGALFTGTSNAEINIGDGIITVDGYTGSITASNATVADKRGATVTGNRVYSMTDGAFASWATVNNNTYFLAGDTLVTGTDSADTINIASADKVLVDGKGGIDTITAATLTGSTINAATDLINVTSGNVKLNVSENSTVNGAQFNGTATADVTIGTGSINVDGFTGSINAGDNFTVTDNRGAKVTGNRAYEISGGAFVTWATVNNESYSFAGDTLAVGTDGNDTINISSADKVSINGRAGVDTITADSLTGATITADGDFINVTSGDIFFDITDGSMINGATFAGTSNADVTIGDGVLTVEVFTGNITAGDLKITDNRGATVTGDKVYTMTGGAFTTWATINNNSYAVVGNTSALGTSGDDTITISDAENVLVDALAGIDTISADSLTNATVNAATDFITVTSGTLDLNVNATSTINGAQFNGTGNADVTLEGSTIHLDTWTGYVNFGEDVTLYDKTGAVIEAGNREFRRGILRTIHSWATINGDTYAIEDEDTVAVGTDGNDTINLEPYDNVSVNGLGGIDTISADSIGAGVTIVANDDFIDITNGAATTFEVVGKSTINGAQFNGTGNAQLSLGQDTITVSDWTGNVNLNADIKLVDKAGSTLTGNVTPVLTSGKVSGITGLDNGESITFGGDTYTMRDDILTVTRTEGTPEIYINATSDTDLLKLSNPYAYIQISDSTLDLNSGAQLLKKGFAAVIYGTESSYSNNYGAALTKDSVDAYTLAQNNLTINEPQLVTSDTKVLTVDFNATLSAASGNYTINGDAYNATTDATISVIPASSSLINGTVSVTDGTIKTTDGNSYAIRSGKGVNLTALEGTVTNLLGTGSIAASMNGDNSFTVNDIKYTAGENSNVNINLENDSPAFTVTSGNINAELATGQTSNLNGATYTANSEIAKLNATADTVTLTLPLNGSAKVGEIIYTGLDEENSAVFSLSGTVTETSNGRFNVDIPQNVSAIIDGTTYTSNQDVNTIEVPATESVRLTSSTEKELDINDGFDNSTFDYRKVDVTATVGAATINSVNEDGTGFLEITGSTDAAVSIASAVTSPYKLNGKDLRIGGDADGYGAVANSDGTLTQLNAISSGVSVVSAPSVTLNTDSTGDYTFNNGAVTISGDSTVALVTDERSKLTGIADLTNGALFTKMESFNLNGNAIGIYGDDGVTLQTDSAGNVVSVGGAADKATINGVGGATVTLPNGGELTINDKPFKLTDDNDGVTISGGRVEGLDNGGKLAVGAGGTYVVNGVEITAPENGATISADNAGTPFIYTGQTASDSLANKIEEITNSEDNINVDDFDSGATTNIDLDAEGKKSVVIGENVSSDKEVNIDASNTNGAFIQNKSDAAVNVALGKNTTLVSSGSANEVIDASKADNAVVVANNGANITNYDPVEKAVKILLEGLQNIVQAIRTDYLSFSNNTIEFGEKKVSLQGTSGNANAAELYNLYMQPTAVQWSTDEGGDVIADSTKNSRNATQVLVGNKKGNKGSANIKGNNANIIAFIGAGDNIDAGGGDNYIEITTERRVNATGAKILLNEKSGNDVIVGFASGYGETADRISVSNTSGTNSRPKFKFINGRLVMQNNNRRLTFQNAYGSAYDSESDIGNVSKLLIETNTGAEKYAIADVDSTIKADQSEAPDVYVGSGSTSGVDFSNYESDIEVNLLNSDKFQNIGNVKGATGVHTLIGSTGNDTLTAGDGRSSIWGGQGNDVMTGSDTDTKINGTKFYFMEGDGNDTISNFEAYDVTRADRADIFTTYNQQVTGVYINGDDLRIRVGNSDDIVRINNMKNKVMAVDLIGVTEGAQVGDNLNFDNFTKYYYGIGNATLNVDINNYSDDINIWLDGSHGKFYHTELNVVDASRSYKKAEIAGNANDNKLIAASGGTSLWGGNGGDDTLAGGDGSDTFFYGYGGGDDVIDGAAGDDIVRAFNIDLSQITNIDITDTNIKLTFNDGNKLSVNSANSGVQFVLDDGSVYTCDQLTRTWTKK